MPDHLIFLLRNLYAGQEVVVRTGHGMMDQFQIGKGICQGCILSSCLFNLYAEDIIWNARLGEAHTGIKIAGGNNLRYADDSTLTTESEEELKSFLMSLKEESEKAGLKFKNEILYGKPRIHVFLLFLMSYHRCVIKLKHFTGKKIQH